VTRSHRGFKAVVGPRKGRTRFCGENRNSTERTASRRRSRLPKKRTLTERRDTQGKKRRKKKEKESITSPEKEPIRNGTDRLSGSTMDACGYKKGTTRAERCSLSKREKGGVGPSQRKDESAWMEPRKIYRATPRT